VSVFRHADGKRWKAVLNYVDHTGKRRQIAKLADTEREAKRFERDFANRRDAYDLPEMKAPTESPGVPTLSAYVDAWIAERLRPGVNQIRRSTELSYRVGLRRVTDRLGDVTLDAIDAAMIERVYDGLRADGLADASMWVTHRALRAVFKSATAGRTPLISWNPLGEVRNGPRKSSGQQVDVLTPAEVDTLIDAADAYEADHDPSPPFGAFVRVLAWTGARLGEMLALRWDDVDLDAGRMTIRASMSKAGEITSTKTDKVRRISLSCQTVDVLRGVLESQLIDRMNAPLGRDKKPLYCNDGYVFANKIGEHLTQSGVENAWRKIRSIAGSKAKLHGLRHAHASALISAGVPITKVAERLGHADVSTTMRVYAHALPADDDRVLDAIDRVYSGK
jgi:integrase